MKTNKEEIQLKDNKLPSKGPEKGKNTKSKNKYKK